jgi:dTDP-4-dehydrorhamnose reductase
MNPDILLIGSNGQVGRELHKTLARLGRVTALDRKQLDLTQPAEIRRAILKFQPRIIVNAAAYTAVDKAESEEALAHAINAEAPAVMADQARKSGAALIHYSTDYVFDGRKNSPYDENDPANPQNAYGRTKLEGERAIQSSGAAHLILRTAWVYATEGRNFLLTILRLATQREELRIVRDQFGAPTLNIEIADATASILAQLCGDTGRGGSPSFADVSGVYHMTAGGETTWYDFTKSILEKAANIPPDFPWFAAATGGSPLRVRRVIPITASEYPTPAQRPPYSVLSNARLKRDFGIQLPDWQTQLQSVFAAAIPTRTR